MRYGNIPRTNRLLSHNQPSKPLGGHYVKPKSVEAASISEQPTETGKNQPKMPKADSQQSATNPLPKKVTSVIKEIPTIVASTHQNKPFVTETDSTKNDISAKPQNKKKISGSAIGLFSVAALLNLMFIVNGTYGLMGFVALTFLGLVILIYLISQLITNINDNTPLRPSRRKIMGKSQESALRFVQLSLILMLSCYTLALVFSILWIDGLVALFGVLGFIAMISFLISGLVYLFSY
ncbi:MAG: hypothetical protein H6607_06765 [Flavobacteriales bacterium]|nr:hypothetical protein [Flavobacteriales bacterium]